MSRQKTHRFTNTSYNVKVKDLKKKDRIHIGGVPMTILKIRKNSSDDRAVSCAHFRMPSDPILLILPKNLKVHVSRTKHKTLKK